MREQTLTLGIDGTAVDFALDTLRLPLGAKDLTAVLHIISDDDPDGNAPRMTAYISAEQIDRLIVWLQTIRPLLDDHATPQKPSKP